LKIAVRVIASRSVSFRLQLNLPKLLLGQLDIPSLNLGDIRITVAHLRRRGAADSVKNHEGSFASWD